MSGSYEIVHKKVQFICTNRNTLFIFENETKKLLMEKTFDNQKAQEVVDERERIKIGVEV